MPRVVKKKSRRVEEVESFLPEGVLKALQQVDASFDATKLLEAIFTHWGGFDRFAFDIVQEYKSAKAGTLTRQRILEMINRLTIFSTQSAGEAVSYDDLEDDDLFAAAAQIMGKVAANGQVTDVKEETREDTGQSAPAEWSRVIDPGDAEGLRQPEAPRVAEPAHIDTALHPRTRRGRPRKLPAC